MVLPDARLPADRQRLPLALALLHRSNPPGTTLRLRFPDENASSPGNATLAAGAGFSSLGHGRYRRERTLPDYIAPGLRVLLCGLNPSLYAADRGIGFSRPGNRFWPAALAAGLVTSDRDPLAAVARGVGMTDLVKRATASAAEVAAAEFRDGFARVRQVVEWLSPSVVCFVGLTGYRIAMDRAAVIGRQDATIGGSIVYVMHNPSGLNAHASVASLGAQFTEVRALAQLR